MIFSIIFTVVFFYTYTGILGTNIAILNIATFYIATLIGEYISYRLMLSNRLMLSKFNCNTKKALILLSILLFLFVLFTYFPPKIMLFKDPISGTYGIIEKP